MQISEYAIVINTIPHGENNAIVTVLTQSHGILRGFAKRVKTKTNPSIFAPGNAIKINYFEREGTMGTISGESYKMYMYSCMENIAKMRFILAICSCVSICIGTSGKHNSDDIFKDLMLFLEGVKHDLPFSQNVFIFSILVKKVLEFCGYAFRLDKCVSTGEQNSEELVFLSPKSGASVSKTAGNEYAHLMLILPKAFVTEDYQDIQNIDDVKNCIKIIDFFVKKNFNKQIDYCDWILEQIR